MISNCPVVHKCTLALSVVRSNDTVLATWDLNDRRVADGFGEWMDLLAFLVLLTLSSDRSTTVC